MSSPLENCPGFFRKQAKDYAESNGNTCGFFVHRNASSHSELTFYSQFFGKYRRSPNLNGIPRAENFVNTSVSTKLPTTKAKRLPARSTSAQSHRMFRIRFMPGSCGQEPSAQAFVLLIIVRSNQTCGLLEPMRLATFAWASTT